MGVGSGARCERSEWSDMSCFIIIILYWVHTYDLSGNDFFLCLFSCLDFFFVQASFLVSLSDLFPFYPTILLIFPLPGLYFLIYLFNLYLHFV